jgi:hypothetical protein
VISTSGMIQQLLIWQVAVRTTRVRHLGLVPKLDAMTLRPETVFLNFEEPRNRFEGIDSASQCSLAGRYDNPLTRFLSPIDCSKIPAQLAYYVCVTYFRLQSLQSKNIPMTGRDVFVLPILRVGLGWSRKWLLYLRRYS